MTLPLVPMMKPGGAGRERHPRQRDARILGQAGNASRTRYRGGRGARANRTRGLRKIADSISRMCIQVSNALSRP